MNNTETNNILHVYGVNRYTGEEQSDNQLLCDANDNVVVVQTDIQQASQNKLILRLKPTKPAPGEFALYKAFKDVCETFTEYVPIGEPYYLNQYCTDTECLYEVDITEAVQDCNLFVIVSKGGSITFAEDVSIVEQPIVNYDFVKDGATLQQEFGTHSVIEANMQRGNLFVAQHLYSAQGNHLPASFGLAYNDRFAKTNVVYGKSIIAKGWKLNYQQFIQFVGDRCLYVDSAFKEHIFTKSDNDTNVYIDSSAQTGYILKKHDNYCEIFDGANTTLCFRSGRLVEITQRKGETPVKTTIYYENGKICKVTDGCGNDYTIEYQSPYTYIKNVNNATLVTMLDDGDEGILSKISYLDGKDCFFEIDDTYRLSSITDESKKEKLVIDYSDVGKVASLQKCAVNNATLTPLENAFIYYSTPTSTILSKNKATDQDLSQIRYRYTFDSNGAVTSVGEIDAAGNPIGTQAFVEKTAVYEKQYTLMGNNKVVNLGSESFERLPELSMSPPYITPEKMAASIESKNGTMLRFSWDIHCDSDLDLTDEVVAFNIFVNGCHQDNACRSYACSSDTIHDSCFVEMPMQQDNISIEIQAIPSMFNVPVVISNVQVEYVPFTTKQLYAKTAISPDAELPNGYISELIGERKFIWKPIDTLEISTDYGTISGLFTFADYQKTLLSYINNPNSFNLYYNDGKGLVTNVSTLKTCINGFMIELDKRPFATVTTSNGQQSFSYIELVEDGLKLSQRLLGVESPQSYTMIDKHLLKVEQWQKKQPKG